MKRTIAMLAALLLSGIGPALAAPAPTPVPGDWAAPNFTVSVQSALIYNNHVGDDWSGRFAVGGVPVERGAAVYVDAACGVEIRTAFEERDKIPDAGETVTVCVPSAEEMETGFTVVQKVYVYENRGRYSGKDACWEATYRFTPVR